MIDLGLASKSAVSAGAVGVALADQGEEFVEEWWWVVTPPGKLHRDGFGIDECAVGNSWARVLVCGCLGGDADGTTGGDEGEPFLDPVGGPDVGRSGVGWPQVGCGGSGLVVEGDRKPGDVAEPETAAAGEGVVGGKGGVAGFDPDQRSVKAAVLQRAAQHGDVADCLGKASTGGGGVHEDEVCGGMIACPASLEPVGVLAERGPGVADAEPARGLSGGAFKVDDLVEDAAGAYQDLGSSLRKGDVSGSPLQQPLAQLMLEARDSTGYRCLGDAELARSLGERSALDYGDQGAELAQLDPTHASSVCTHCPCIYRISVSVAGWRHE